MPQAEDCKRFIECLSAHFDGELDEELLVKFEEHIESCERARALVHTFERTIILHRRSRSETVPSDIHARLMDAIRACESGEDD